jgi:hypothetical protein
MLKTTVKNDFWHCEDCHSQIILSNATYVCPACGLVKDQQVFEEGQIDLGSFEAIDFQSRKELTLLHPLSQNIALGPRMRREADFWLRSYLTAHTNLSESLIKKFIFDPTEKICRNNGLRFDGRHITFYLLYWLRDQGRLAEYQKIITDIRRGIKPFSAFFRDHFRIGDWERFLSRAGLKLRRFEKNSEILLIDSFLTLIRDYFQVSYDFTRKIGDRLLNLLKIQKIWRSSMLVSAIYYLQPRCVSSSGRLKRRVLERERLNALFRVSPERKPGEPCHFLTFLKNRGIKIREMTIQEEDVYSR